MVGLRTVSVALDMWRAGREGPAGLERRQRERLTSLVSHVRVYSPLFRRLYSGIGFGPVDLRDLPVTRKPELMAEFDDWLTDRRVTRAEVDAFVADLSLAGDPFLDEYFVCTTSGTTGRPGIFLADHETLAVAEACNALGGMRLLPRARWRRMIAQRLRHALVVGTGGHFAGAAMHLREQREGRHAPAREQLIPVEQPLGDVVAQLNRLRPAILQGYPSVIRQLAAEQRAGRLRIAPGLIGMAGESVSSEERQEMAAAFGAPTVDGYAASECLLVAFSCEHEWLHYRSDWMILEPVDENLDPVLPGERSHTVLLTDLSNRVQPVIRYDLGDSILVRPDPCPCGDPLPAIRVIGRRDDVLTFPRNGEPVEILPLAIVGALEQIRGLELFQLVQTGPQQLSARLACTDGTDIESVRTIVRERLGSFLSAQGLDPVHVEVEDLPLQPRGPSGKFRQVIGQPARERSSAAR